LLIRFSHGYLRALTFWIVGEIYHYSGTRLLYLINGLFIRDNLFSLLGRLINLLRGSMPYRVGYTSEYILFSFVDYCMFFFIFYLLYFFFDFYMVVFSIISLWMGKNLKELLAFLLRLVLSFILSAFNFFSFLLQGKKTNIVCNIKNVRVMPLLYLFWLELRSYFNIFFRLDVFIII
jgi:hypothetical protein